jgi:hypothetical protein
MYSRFLICVHSPAQLEDEQSVISEVIVFMNSTVSKPQLSHNALILPTAIPFQELNTPFDDPGM